MATMYTINEAADLLRVHHATIRRMIERGELRAVKVGWQWRIPASEIDRITWQAAPKAEG